MRSTFLLTVFSFTLTSLCSAEEGTNYAFEARTITADDLTVEASDDDSSHLTVVCFLGAECPMARIYGPRLSALQKEFGGDQLRVIGINSNRQDSFADITDYIAELNIDFPFVQDKQNVIADQFAATRTPEVFLLNAKLELLYHGRIDDQYEPGVNRAAPKRSDLRAAIEEMIAGKAISVARTEPTGCLIGKVKSRTQFQPVENEITYTKHVAPVLQTHCVECHRDGEIGPFAMDSFAEVAGWADTMLETIDNGRMPPWHAGSSHGDFLNARHMPVADKQVFRDWIAGGLKKGNPDDLPPAIEYTAGWQLERAPDRVIEMRDRPFSVPSDGVVEYQYFVADPGFTEDNWITGAQVVPGARAVVHHAIVFVRPPDGANARGVGWLAAYVPGQRQIPLPPGRARRVPAGSKLVFQMHYTPNGKPQEDITKVGLVFAEESAITHELFTLIALNQEFEIPPGADRHVVKAKVPWLPDEGELLAATPHMHYRGKAFRVLTGTDSDDSEAASVAAPGSASNGEQLLEIPNYDFNWQHTYAFKEPIPLQNLDTLRIEATFDNSEANPFNPDASEWVTWGDQTWEEMAVAFFEVSQPRKPGKRNKKPVTAQSAQQMAQQTADRERKIDAYVKRAFEKMDLNNDGQITQSEAPIVVRRFSHFWTFDRNGDDVATPEEIRELAETIF